MKTEKDFLKDADKIIELADKYTRQHLKFTIMVGLNDAYQEGYSWAHEENKEQVK